MSHNVKNHLLAMISDADRAALRLEDVELDKRFRLEEPMIAAPYLYFIEAGMASISYLGRGTNTAAVAVIGREGFSGTGVLLGAAKSPSCTMMVVPGRAHRASVKDALCLMDRSRFFRRIILRYVHAMTIQHCETALSASRGTLLQRLARCLLMAHDRLEQKDVPLTHEQISVMLACRRAGITGALCELHAKGFILQPSRGTIRLLDRQGLISTCQPFYGGSEGEFTRLSAINESAPLDS